MPGELHNRTSPAVMDMALRVRRLRFAGVQHRDVAAHCGLSPAQLSQLLNGHRTVVGRLGVVRQAVEALEVQTSVLVTEGDTL